MELVPPPKSSKYQSLGLSHFVNSHGTGPPLYSYTLNFWVILLTTQVIENVRVSDPVIDIYAMFFPLQERT